MRFFKLFLLLFFCAAKLSAQSTVTMSEGVSEIANTSFKRAASSVGNVTLTSSGYLTIYFGTKLYYEGKAADLVMNGATTDLQKYNLIKTQLVATGNGNSSNNNGGATVDSSLTRKVIEVANFPTDKLLSLIVLGMENHTKLDSLILKVANTDKQTVLIDKVVEQIEKTDTINVRLLELIGFLKTQLIKSDTLNARILRLLNKTGSNSTSGDSLGGTGALAHTYSIEFKPAVQQAVFNGATYTSWPAFYAAFVAVYNADPQGDFYFTGTGGSTYVFQASSQLVRTVWPKYDYYLYRYDPSNGQTYGMFYPTDDIKECIDKLNFNFNNGAPINQMAIAHFEMASSSL